MREYMLSTTKVTTQFTTRVIDPICRIWALLKFFYVKTEKGLSIHHLH